MLLASCAHKPSDESAAPASAPTATSTTSATSASTAKQDVAVGQPRCVLRWQTETESNSFGYYVFRADSGATEFQCVNVGNPLHAAGTSTMPLKYVYFDLSVALGKTYLYKLQGVDLDGSTEWVIGGETPAPGRPKPLTEAEVEEIRTKGPAYREEAK
jgi:hypothetical protein